MLIDWGFVTLNHTIPSQLLENQDITADEATAIIQSMAPPEPIVTPIPPAVLSLVVDPTTVNDSILLPNELIL